MFAPSLICAQKEASVWPVGSGKQINFQSGNFEISDFPGNPNAKATICDKDGNLVLYTDGYTIWNKNSEVLINGENLSEKNYTLLPGSQPIFIPYPKKDGYYFLIYEPVLTSNGNYNITDQKIVYAEININSYSGRGEVISKNRLIHTNYHSEPTIAGFCNNSYFWLAIDRNSPDKKYENSRDIINFYKIDENGINPTPKVNSFFDIGNSGSYRFSPNGDKIFFTYQENQYQWVGDIIADFNFLTGELYNYRTFQLNSTGEKEFSPNSRMVYYFSGTKLIQLDAVSTNVNKVNQSVNTILNLAANESVSYSGMELKLASDGKIYFSYFDIGDGNYKLGRINKPNETGIASEPELDLYTFNFYPKFIQFVTSFCRDKIPGNLDEIFPDAGPDLKVCLKSKNEIGVIGNPAAFYLWQPETFLDNPFSAVATFSAPLQQNSPETIVQTLRVTDGNCWINFDETQVTILPKPAKISIDGSWSVCPFVKEVDYWTTENGYKISWFVDGGEIASDFGTDSIKINWLETNPKALVRSLAIDESGCISDTSVFPVRINVELITESPKGPDRVCIAESKNVNYQIKNTNGSVYNWVPEKGEVVAGQGTNKVAINWLGEGTHQLTVEESSTTIDTICFGESNPLMVEVVNDSLEIELLNVFYNPEQIIILNYNSEKLSRTNHIAFLEIQDESGNTLKEMNVTGIDDGSFYYLPPVSFSYPAILNLKILNTCNEMFYSNPQQVIVLDGIENVVESTISLNWNINKYWENDDLEHEIWFSENGKSNWRMVAKTEKNDFDFSRNGLTLTHFFKVYEHNKSGNTGSWSNTIKVEVEGKLLIPDVFTPNGDGINDEWKIRNVQFHPFQQALIYNRHGQVIYECKNEFIPWDGRINGEIIQGTYLYQITFDTENKKYGQVTVLQ